MPRARTNYRLQRAAMLKASGKSLRRSRGKRAKAPGPPPSTDRGSRVAGRYEVLDLLASGGSAVVHEVQHVRTGARYALKRLHADLLSDDGVRERFCAEARIAAAIDSEHVVRVFDAGTDDDGAPFLVMERLRGQPLDQAARNALPRAYAFEVLRQVALGLAKVHAAGFIHCDLKPENIFVCARDDGGVLVKILDFGIARPLAECALPDGLAFGTPLYMAPEQAHGDNSKIGRETDTWALGMLAYRLFRGSDYFPLEEPLQMTMFRVVHDPLLPPSRRGLCLPGFDAWFSKSCSRDLSQRFTSALTQVRELHAALTGEGQSAPSPGPAPLASEVSRIAHTVHALQAHAKRFHFQDARRTLLWSLVVTALLIGLAMLRWRFEA